MKTPLEILLGNEEKVLDSIEIEQAPSGEWEEYNIAYLEHSSYIDGIARAIHEVGTCAECIYREPDNKGCDIYESLVTEDTWYCGTFERKIGNNDSRQKED